MILRIVVLAMALICSLCSGGACAGEYVCWKFGFSVNVPAEIFDSVPVVRDEVWLRFVSKEDADVSIEVSVVENPDNLLDDYVIRYIKPGMTILTVKEYNEQPKYYRHELAYERQGLTEVVITRLVYWQKSRHSFVCTAHYVMPTEKFDKYRPVIGKIDASWRLYETEEKSEEDE